jgi:alpha-L-arabinofuranosidase
MLTASVTLDPDFAVAGVNRRTFGSFVEHMGRCVYTGIFEPGHEHADDNGEQAQSMYTFYVTHGRSFHLEYRASAPGREPGSLV